MSVNQFGVDMSQYAPNEQNIFNRGWNFLKGSLPSGQDITDAYGQNEGEGSILQGTKERPGYDINLADMWRNYVEDYDKNMQTQFQGRPLFDTEYGEGDETEDEVPGVGNTLSKQELLSLYGIGQGGDITGARESAYNINQRERAATQWGGGGGGGLLGGLFSKFGTGEGKIAQNIEARRARKAANLEDPGDTEEEETSPFQFKPYEYKNILGNR